MAPRSAHTATDIGAKMKCNATFQTKTSTVCRGCDQCTHQHTSATTVPRAMERLAMRPSLEEKNAFAVPRQKVCVCVCD